MECYNLWHASACNHKNNTSGVANIGNYQLSALVKYRGYGVYVGYPVPQWAVIPSKTFLTVVSFSDYCWRSAVQVMWFNHGIAYIYNKVDIKPVTGHGANIYLASHLLL